MLRFAEFDLSEMSVSSLMMARARGDDRFVGIPVFTTRRMFHTGVLVRRDASIETPADLIGRRVGVPEYQQTAALWVRGILQDEFGVRPQDMEFWMERNPDRSHGAATGFRPPEGVTINPIPPDKSIGSMMLSGELEAALFYIVDRNLVDRSKEDLWNHPDITTLFPDPLAEGVRYWTATGVYPINHGMVIRRELAETHPWAVLNVLKAFREASEIADRERVEQAAYHHEIGLLPADALAKLRRTLLRHGLPENRKTLDTLARYSFRQGLTPELADVEGLFAESTRG
jgi:4,5-dihydroxyphthalate decarboxylase